ncbi:hypothetical protein G9A89_012102 [Geosiphon pyriformis]|nr:hypothetical protein G9A89_012102 [Geosiphon pyriformis]
MVRPHVPEDLNSVIQHAKKYEMAMEEAICTKLINLAIGETSSAAEKKIDQLTKKNCHYCGISGHWKRDCRKLQRDQQNRSNQRYSPLQQFYYQLPLPAYYPSRPQYQNNYYQPTLQPIQQQYQQSPTPHYQNFYHTALSEGRAAARQQNPSYILTTIPPARIAENANLSDIFPFKFEANKSPFLLSNAVANKQKAIIAIYTEAKVEGKPIRLILDSRSIGSIITYQLMQQLKRNVDRPAQTIIVTADGIKKTPVGEIDNFSFTIDRITIPVKVLVMDAPQYQALVGNNWLQKANANLNWETQEQHARVPATCGIFNKCSEKAPAFEFEPEEEKPIIETFMALESTSNWAKETEQEHFTSHSEPETPG